MANTLVTSSIIVAETLRVLHNKSAFLGNINTQYDDQFARSGAKAGETINVKRPVQYTIRDGAVASIQDVNQTKVPLTIQPEFGIDWDFSDRDLTLSVDNFSKEFLEPAGTRLAAELDLRIGSLYKQVANFTGTPGTVPATALSALLAGVLLDDNAAPRDDKRTMALNPLANATLVSGLSGLLNSQTEVSKQYKSGVMGSSLGMDFIMSQNLPTHTVGAHGGTPLTNGANQGVSAVGATDNPYAATTTLVTDGWTNSITGILKAGDVITIAGVYAVNPETKQSTGQLRTFVVTADVNSGASTGPANVIISPAIIASGAYQNCSNLAADGQAIVVKTGTASTAYNQNILYHKDAFTLATVDMDIPKGMDMAARSVYDGVSLRFVRGFDIVNNRRICRFDILAGMAALRPEWACRLTS
jgi:hypothetical protein